MPCQEKTVKNDVDKLYFLCYNRKRKLCNDCFSEEKMPPKFKFTKEEIIAAATNVIRKGGSDRLTARALAEELGSSPKPIFGLFNGMEEVRSEVIKAADDIYKGYLQREMSGAKYPPYKASGIAYILFAKDEPELFKLLFMRDRSGETVIEDRESIRHIIDIIMKNLEISEDDAYALHLNMWIYVHGIATMMATSYIVWDIEFISQALTDAYMGFKCKYTGGR